MGGEEAAAMIAFVFAVPFLAHFIFGRAMERGERIPKLPIYVIAVIGGAGALTALFARA